MFIPIPTVTMKERKAVELVGGQRQREAEKKESFCNSALCVAVRSLCSRNETAGWGTQLLEVI